MGPRAAPGGAFQRERLARHDMPANPDSEGGLATDNGVAVFHGINPAVGLDIDRPAQVVVGRFGARPRTGSRVLRTIAGARIRVAAIADKDDRAVDDTPFHRAFRTP